MTRYDASPGDEDSGIGLRASLSTCMADVRMPADLLERAAARNRKRTARHRLIGTASAVAVVAAAATMIVSVPGQSAGRKAPVASAAAPQVQTAAYVLQRAATAEVNSYHLISVSQNSGNTVYTDVATQQQRIVAGLRDSAGEPYFQITDVIKGGVWTDTTIDNQHHAYAIVTASTKDHGPFGAAGLTISSFLPLQTQSDPAAAFQAALKQGIITVVGPRNLDGRDTILIRVKRPLNKQERVVAAMRKHSKGAAPTPSNEIWVDASTYLVVQTKTVTMASTSFITRVSWLPAARGNLAKLTVTPPPGYAQVPYSEMVKYLGPIS
jgi:hypothetical protein